MWTALELLRANLAGDPRAIMSHAHVEQIIAEIVKLEAAHGQNVREIDRLRAELAALTKANADLGRRHKELAGVESELAAERENALSSHRALVSTRARLDAALAAPRRNREGPQMKDVILTDLEIHQAAYLAVVKRVADERDEAERILKKAREFVRWFTPREDITGDRAKDIAIAIDAYLKMRDERRNG